VARFGVLRRPTPHPPHPLTTGADASGGTSAAGGWAATHSADEGIEQCLDCGAGCGGSLGGLPELSLCVGCMGATPSELRAAVVRCMGSAALADEETQARVAAAEEGMRESARACERTGDTGAGTASGGPPASPAYSSDYSPDPSPVATRPVAQLHAAAGMVGSGAPGWASWDCPPVARVGYVGPQRRSMHQGWSLDDAPGWNGGGVHPRLRWQVHEFGSKAGGVQPHRAAGAPSEHAPGHGAPAPRVTIRLRGESQVREPRPPNWASEWEAAQPWHRHIESEGHALSWTPGYGYDGPDRAVPVPADAWRPTAAGALPEFVTRAWTEEEETLYAQSCLGLRPDSEEKFAEARHRCPNCQGGDGRRGSTTRLPIPAMSKHECDVCKRVKLRHGHDYHSCAACGGVGALGGTGTFAQDRQLGMLRCDCGEHFCTPYPTEHAENGSRCCFEEHVRQHCQHTEVRAQWDRLYGEGTSGTQGTRAWSAGEWVWGRRQSSTWSAIV